VWLVLPVAAWAYHLGPGQERMCLDDAAALVRTAEDHARWAATLSTLDGDEAGAQEWALAEAAYAEALGLLPEDRVALKRRVRLERAKCQLFLSELPEANAQLQALVDELNSDAEAEPELVRDAQRALANSHYYMTWLMRLEGAGREEWEPRIEAARQVFKLLTVEADAGGTESEQRTSREDLEAAIRLARMDLGELQGLPLPSQ
jgi:hypothetical protein